MAANCLTSAEAAAVNKICEARAKGNRIWYPLDRGTYFGDNNFTFDGLDGAPPLPLAAIQFECDEIDQG
jgi:hypothetical protein